MDKHTISYAEKLLWTWGTQIRTRIAKGESKGAYWGNIDAGAYKPLDDPHPHAFVVCQVERCLKNMSDAHREFAWHSFVMFKPDDEFDQGRRRRDNLKREIMAKLADEVASRYFSSQVEQNAETIMQELRKLRGMKGGRNLVRDF